MLASLLLAAPDAQPFGKYQLLDRIAAGGMAEIYRARYQAAAGVTKPVVIKKILPHYAGNKNFIQMFINEARIVVGLSHGNIAQVFDFGEIDGEYFLAMEFVHGQPLSKVVRRARELQIPVLPTPFAVFIALEMCRGLHYAHTRLDDKGRPLNIVHRDVSPQNVILAYEGQVKLVDFGIAKARTAGRTETEAGAVKGKYIYFAPEQARGKELDSRSDVFACGIVLYEMLCGRMPFEGKMIEVLSKIVKGQFDRPRVVNPDITPALERIILTAMAHDKNDRYPSAQAMGEALAGYLYANAPTFSTDQLSKLLMYLYEKELVAEGLPVQLSRDFLEQVPLWKKVLPNSTSETDSGALPTNAAKPSSKRRGESNINTRAAEPSRSGLKSKSRSTKQYIPSANEPRKLPKWPFVVMPAVASLLAGVLVFAVSGSPTFNVQLSSQPRGAGVIVDGVLAPQQTPMMILNLPTDRAHSVEVVAPGHKAWSRQVLAERDETLQLEAVLEPERPPQDLVVVKPPTITPPVVVPPKQNPVLSEHRWPVNQEIEVLANGHSFDVQPSRAARIRLDPKKTYKIWAEGKLSLGGLLDNIYFEQVFYSVDGDVQPKDAYGIVDKKGITVKNATALYAWLFDVKPSDNTGAIKLRIQAKGSSAISTLVVDARENFIDLEPPNQKRVRISGLPTYGSVEVVVKEGDPPATLDGTKRGRVNKVLYFQNSGFSVAAGKPLSHDDQRVLEVGKRYEMTGVNWMIFAFPDSSPDDNAGSIKLEISAVTAPAGLRNVISIP